MVPDRIKFCAILLFSAFLVLFISAHGAADRSMRCNGRVISVGADIDQVQEKCGEPESHRQWEEGYPGGYKSRIFDYKTERYIAPELIKEPVRMQRWTYNLGSTRFKRHLYFENEKLIRIETGEKGSD